MALFSKKRFDQLVSHQEAGARPHLVMIVDDEAENRAVMRAMLRHHYRLLEAADGVQALALIENLSEQDSLACIVSDHRMPHLTGVELFERVQVLRPQTCRIIVTGFVDIDTVVDAINKAGIYKFIIKPFDANDFLLTVRRAVEAFDLQSRLSAYQGALEEQVRERTRELADEQAKLVAANRELRRASEEVMALYDNASCGYHSLDADGVFVQINHTELGWLGRSREELVGKMRFHEVLVPASAQALFARFPAIREQGWLQDMNDVEVEFLRPDGATVPALLRSTIVADAAHAQGLNRFTVFDISERKSAERLVRHMASHDALTGLPNRALLEDRIGQALVAAARSGQRVAIAFVDLDHFKEINDTLGHQCGDELLQAVALRLVDTVRASDTVARIGGDEFVFVLPQCGDRSDVVAVADKVVNMMATPFLIDGHEINISASVGISIFPDNGVASDLLMRRADEAMYRAKKLGRNNYQFSDVS